MPVILIGGGSSVRLKMVLEILASNSEVAEVSTKTFNQQFIFWEKQERTLSINL